MVGRVLAFQPDSLGLIPGRLTILLSILEVDVSLVVSGRGSDNLVVGFYDTF